jgi:sulfotransferase family protein
MNKPLRIAMWSGPRNISTAMMRAWENRGDCTVTDEPLYAAFLAASGIDHPGRDDVITAGETDVRKVVASLLGPIPGGKPIWYQKHMAHHLLPATPREWIPELTNLLLIRDPGEVVSSYIKSRASVTAEDIGLPQQTDLYDAIAAASGAPPPVIDAGDFLRAPEAYLRALCEMFGIAFTARMLEWPAGRRASDGIWAKYWYAAVEASTGFEAWRPREVKLGEPAARVVEACMPHYRRLHAVRMLL